MGANFGGVFDPAVDYDARPYFVPDDALPSKTAKVLGIETPEDLFGGVVPFPFVATKAITHPLWGASSRAPVGWSSEFSQRVDGAVLRGYTAFASDDVLHAVRELLDDGPVRLKVSTGIGGGGQVVVEDLASAELALQKIDASALAQTGLVIEENLEGVTTYSVGRVAACGLTLSYVGTQRTVSNRQGREVYGGSTIDCVRGGFRALIDAGRSAETQLAIEFARRYDEAALRSYPGLFASRRNYDVASGTNARGLKRIGVLEQSWRVGGASGAELRALEAFLDDAELTHVRASTVETYDDDPRVPDDAFLYFRGMDAHGSPLAKYATLDAHGNAR